MIEVVDVEVSAVAEVVVVEDLVAEIEVDSVDEVVAVEVAEEDLVAVIVAASEDAVAHQMAGKFRLIKFFDICIDDYLSFLVDVVVSVAVVAVEDSAVVEAEVPAAASVVEAEVVAVEVDPEECEEAKGFWLSLTSVSRASLFPVARRILW